jgi:transposase
MEKPVSKIGFLGHYGLVKTFIDELGITSTIDEKIQKPKRKISVGNAVATMILNGMGFTGQALYLTPTFYRNLPVEILFGIGVKPEDFNDDSLGTALDALYEAGITELFYYIAQRAIQRQGIDQSFVHLDSTSFSFHGAYEGQDEPDEDGIGPFEVVQLTHGYSKDNRSDLKQVILQMMCTKGSTIPTWIEVLDGNTSDKTSFRETIKKFREQVADQLQMPVIVADSALYSEQTLQDLTDINWITRVPENIKLAKVTIEKADPSSMAEIIEGYKVKSVSVSYGGINQRWLVVFSEAAHTREMATFNKNLKKKREEAEKALWHLSNQEFACETDANAAVKRLQKELKFHDIQFQIESKPHYAGKGKPGANAVPTHYGWFVKGIVVENHIKLQQATARKGFFIIATNVRDEQELSDAQMLSIYKAQGISIERGFRFLKDPMFFAESLYLKSPKRIMALLMVMTLSLLVYSLAERSIRKSLSTQEVTVRNQVNKQTSSPTLRWVFMIFNESMYGQVTLPNGETYWYSQINDDTKTILNALGPPFLKCYFLL